MLICLRRGNTLRFSNIIPFFLYYYGQPQRIAPTRMKQLLFYIFLFFSFVANGQSSDTIIDGNNYSIISRYKSGAIKKIGQFGLDCSGHNRKHGIFIYYFNNGAEKKRKVYKYGTRRNHSFLGLKMGWWGIYSEELYFFGKLKASIISDPCF